MRLIVATDATEFAQSAANLVCEAVRDQPDAILGLPSGRTPLAFYDELARRVGSGEAGFSGVTAFAIDELYGVPRDHPATNASYFRRHLTERIPLRALRVMDSEAPDADAECARFLKLIDAAGGLDLAVLGVGVNGHIAFNEPGSPFDSRARRIALERSTREPYAQAFGSLDAVPTHGLTLGIADLMAARRILLLASGALKAKAVAEALEGRATEEVPASVLQRHPDVTVVLDREAASLLKPNSDG